MNKQNKIFTIFILVMIVVIFVVVYSYQNDLEIVPVTLKNKKPRLQNNNFVKYKMNFNMGNDQLLGLVMAIPYKGRDQQKELIKNKTRIKNDLITTVDQNEIKRWVKNRNYLAIKQTFINVLNKNLKKPIETIHFETFFYH